MFTKHAVETDRAVGVQLQNLRVFRNMTRQQAADRIGLKASHLAEIEDGTVRPAPSVFLQIIRLYDVAPSRAFAVASHSPDMDSSL